MFTTFTREEETTILTDIMENGLSAKEAQAKAIVGKLSIPASDLANAVMNTMVEFSDLIHIIPREFTWKMVDNSLYCENHLVRAF